MNPLRAVAHWGGRQYMNSICASEAESQVFQHHNERPVEYAFALGMLVAGRPRRVLDVGTGQAAWPSLLRHCGFLVTAIDNVRDYWPAGMTNRHWRVEDVDITKPDGFRGQFGAVTCISVIEHIEDHESAFRNMLTLSEPGGLGIVTTPYNDRLFDLDVYVRPDAAKGHSVPYKCRSSTAREIEKWAAMGATLERRDLWRMWSGPVWFTGERIPWEPVASENEPHQLGLFAFRKR